MLVKVELCDYIDKRRLQSNNCVDRLFCITNLLSEIQGKI